MNIIAGIDNRCAIGLAMKRDFNVQRDIVIIIMEEKKNTIQPSGFIPWAYANLNTRWRYCLFWLRFEYVEIYIQKKNLNIVINSTETFTFFSFSFFFLNTGKSIFIDKSHLNSEQMYSIWLDTLKINKFIANIIITVHKNDFPFFKFFLSEKMQFNRKKTLINQKKKKKKDFLTEIFNFFEYDCERIDLRNEFRLPVYFFIFKWIHYDTCLLSWK